MTSKVKSKSCSSLSTCFTQSSGSTHNFGWVSPYKLWILYALICALVPEMLVCNGSSWNISNICWAVGNSIVLVASQTTIVSGYCCKKCYYHGYRTSLSGIIIGSMIEIETKEDNGHSLYGCDFIDGVGGIVCSRTIYKRYMQSTSAWIWSWIRILQFRSMRKYHSGHCQIRQLKKCG